MQEEELSVSEILSSIRQVLSKEAEALNNRVEKPVTPSLSTDTPVLEEPKVPQYALGLIFRAVGAKIVLPRTGGCGGRKRIIRGLARTGACARRSTKRRAHGLVSGRATTAATTGGGGFTQINNAPSFLNFQHSYSSPMVEI